MRKLRQKLSIQSKASLFVELQVLITLSNSGQTSVGTVECLGMGSWWSEKSGREEAELWTVFRVLQNPDSKGK